MRKTQARGRPGVGVLGQKWRGDGEGERWGLRGAMKDVGLRHVNEFEQTYMTSQGRKCIKCSRTD